MYIHTLCTCKSIWLLTEFYVVINKTDKTLNTCLLIFLFSIGNCHFNDIYYICTFFVTFFSATIDGRNMIFGHKLYIGTPYRGKRFVNRQIPKWAYTKCMFNVNKNQQSRQTGSRNLMGPKMLPTIWGTYMKVVTKYQISAIISCCFTSVLPSVRPSYFSSHFSQ
jgi:hypothetical protein